MMSPSQMKTSLLTLAMESNNRADDSVRSALLQLPNWMRVAGTGGKHNVTAKQVIENTKYRSLFNILGVNV
jgi:hypothetical protein